MTFPAWFRLLAIFTLLSALGACDRLGSMGGSLAVKRQIILNQFLGGEAHALLALPDGDVVIAGDIGRAFAARVTRDGLVKWVYSRQDVRFPRFPAFHSEFVGVSLLTSGKLVLCGDATIPTPEDSIHGKQVGLISIIDSDGALIEERHLTPNEDPQYFSTDVHRCMTWNDGVAVIASATNGHGGVGWLIKLDGEGNKAWDVVGQQGLAPSEFGGGNVVVAPDGGLLLTTDATHNYVRATRVLHVTENGSIDKQVVLAGDHATLLRSISGAKTTDLILAPDERPVTLTVLDAQLQGKGTEIDARSIFIDPPQHRGCGFRLSDGSIILFGSKNGSLAAVGLIQESHGLSGLWSAVGPFKEWIPGDQFMHGIWMADAVAVGPSGFVSVHSQIGSDSWENTRHGVIDKHRSGIVLSWIEKY